jgi:Trypsin-like peptidase domain
MAILQQASHIYGIDDLTGALQHLARSVMRVGPNSSDPSGMQIRCAGWFIAPTLVLVPGYAVTSPQTDSRMEVLEQGEQPWRTVATEAPELLGLGLLPQARSEPALALLRVETASPERVLPLSFDFPTQGDPICLVHFPLGILKASASFGQVISVDELFVTYDADTQPGSGGAPILDASWRVVGLHIGSVEGNQANQGLTRGALLKALRESKHWSEIAEQHRLADYAAAKATLQESAPAPEPPQADPGLVRAALTASIDPQSLAPEQEAQLRNLVVDANAPRWVLRAAERRRIISAVGSLNGLRKLKPQARRVEAEDALQQVIDAILKGPPYRLADLDEDALGWWIQAVRWFEPVEKGLPTPAEIARELERRRVRSRLDKVVGPDFQGRKTELAMLRKWYQRGAGPLLLTGIGGIGKSALVARFASQLNSNTLLLWLDFDRADLAPDDAVSVLAAIADQASVQVDGIEKPQIGEGGWQNPARTLGGQLSRGTSPALAPLLVLDSFEAAQYAQRYQALWPVLEEISRALPKLRVCVTGRAPVPGLTLRGRAAQVQRLDGLAPVDARQWLRSRGVTEPNVLEEVLARADGIPLILRLALRLIEVGGKVSDLPRDLPAQIKAGFLYDRILDRVQNPDFKPLATGLLVLRRFTADMIKPVLDGLVPFPPGEPSDWFVELAREMSLVAGGGALEQRSEVRAATLWLLERDQGDLVRSVDESAARWYSDHAEDTESAAELVYHRLRLGDVAGAAQAWRDGCGAFLTYAADDIRDPAARAWLEDRLGGAPDRERSTATWEQDAAERIRSVRTRGVRRVAGEILRERSERTDNSPLVFHEAFELRAGGQGPAACEVLDHAGYSSGPVGRDRYALRALLALDAGDRRMADALLARIQDKAQWTDRTTRDVDALAVLAARINCTVALEDERTLLNQSDDGWEHVRSVLSPVDVNSPRLQEMLRSSGTLERTPELLSLEPNSLASRLLACLDQERAITAPAEPAVVRSQRMWLLESWARGESWGPPELTLRDFGLSGPHDAIIPQLADFGWHRWWLAARTDFLSRAYRLCTGETATASPVGPAIMGTLALFAHHFQTFGLGSDISIYDALHKSPLAHGAIRLPNEAWPQLKKILQWSVDPLPNWDEFVRDQGDDFIAWGRDLIDFRSKASARADPGPFLLFLFASVPLERLVEDLAGTSTQQQPQ